ncbi:MAG TPA: response regulator [Aggregatilineales bacterium]|nr:response regulator [Aggregatilineales bacterium]
MVTFQAGYAIVVDDEPANRDFLEKLLGTANFKVIGATSGAEALASARKTPELTLALVDYELPDMTGVELIRQLRALNPEALLVMATMHDDRALIDRAFAEGLNVFLVKPHGFMELYRRLQTADARKTLLSAMIIDQYGPRPYRGSRGGRRPGGTGPLTEVKPPTPSESTAPTPPPASPITPPAPAEPTVPTAAPSVTTAPTQSPRPAEPTAVTPTPAPASPTTPAAPTESTTPSPPAKPTAPTPGSAEEPKSTPPSVSTAHI